jgi:hypothetical protein
MVIIFEIPPILWLPLTEASLLRAVFPDQKRAILSNVKPELLQSFLEKGEKKDLILEISHLNSNLSYLQWGPYRMTKLGNSLPFRFPRSDASSILFFS